MNVAEILEGYGKYQVFETIRDRVLTPMNLDGIEMDDYFVQSSWSCVPVFTGVNRYEFKIASIYTVGLKIHIFTHLPFSVSQLVY